MYMQFLPPPHNHHWTGGKSPFTDNPMNTQQTIASDVPPHEVHEFAPRRTRYCVVIVIWNEGERIKRQLERMKPRAELADIIIADGRSSDGSTAPAFLTEMGVRSLLITDERGLCTATRMGLAYALEQGYEGVITLDGNGKDGVEALPAFIQGLEEGFDLVQGSRFMKGGTHKNTPLIRYLGIHLLISPLLGVGGFYYTDPSNAFRAMSRRFLTDPRVQPFRKEFVRFNLQLYLVYRAAQLEFRIKEIPVVRVYPDDGTVPTKVVGFRTNWLYVRELLITVAGGYTPK